MNTDVSIAQVLSELQVQLAHHEEQEAFHAQQEVFHREQRALHAEGLVRVREHFEIFKAGVSAAGEIFAELPPLAPPAPRPVESDPDEGRRPTVAKLVSRLVSGKAADETLTPSSVAEELNQRFAAKMRRSFDSRGVSVYLRRLLTDGTLRLVRKGGAAHEAAYARRH